MPRCDDPDLKSRITVNIDLVVENGTAEVITQSGPYRMPVADMDGKTILGIFLPRGEVFQGFLQEAIPGGLIAGTMQGATASMTTDAVFPPGEYELLMFVDSAVGGGIGPQRGDLASFDNTDCEPTGVSVRIPVACGDASVTLTNRHFIIF